MGPGWGIFRAGAATVAPFPNIPTSSGRVCRVAPGSDMGLRGRGRLVMIVGLRGREADEEGVRGDRD